MMQAGQHVTASLRLVRQLGQGGMGAVWIADHLGLGAQVAVKFMWQKFAEHPQFIERFRREAGAAARLKSPHVAQVFDHGVASTGEPYIVMELLEGEDLGHRVKRDGALRPLLVADIVTQAARALGKAHQLGIVHRDIKADNIFLTDMEGDVFVKVLDFGIAKVNDDANVSMTSTGGTIGTPLFMSPEQFISAKHVDHRADLWSLAVVAYYALIGRVPFPGDTIGAISVAVHAGEFAAPSTLRQDLPPELDAWFRRMFRRLPAERYGSAKEMADAFREALGGRPTQPPITVATAADKAPAPEIGVAPGTAGVAPRATGVAPGTAGVAPTVNSPSDTSAPTLEGKTVTLGTATEKRRVVLPLILGVVALMVVVVVVATVRPWSRASGSALASSGQPIPGATLPVPSGPNSATASLEPPIAGASSSAASSLNTAPPSSTVGADKPAASASGSADSADPGAATSPTATSASATTSKSAGGRTGGRTGTTKSDEDPGF